LVLLTRFGGAEYHAPAMPTQMPFIDPHVHVDSRSAEEFPRLAAAGCVGLLAVAGPGGGFSTPQSLRDHFRRLALVDRCRVEDAGLKFWLALGAHPLGLPESGLDEFLDAWPADLTQYKAQAVGEIGLETGSDTELRVLRRGYAVALESGLPVILHTPRRDKATAMEKTLELLSESGLDPSRVLLDHLDEEVFERAKASGCMLGLSVHPAKLSPERAARLLAEHGPERLVIDSDMGANPSYLFALPATISAMRELNLSEETVTAVVCGNAATLLGKNP
jgi:predicted metal-dependent TIM-barrel fold hydrolase